MSACCTSCVVTQMLNEVTERGMAPLAPRRINTIAYDAKNEFMPCACGLGTCMTYCCGYCEVAATYSREIGVVSTYIYLYIYVCMPVDYIACVVRGALPHECVAAAAPGPAGRGHIRE